MRKYMKKDAFYLKHDIGAARDENVIFMMSKYGVKGYGLYWLLNEYLREQTGCRGSIDRIPAIAYMLRVDTDELKTFITDCIDKFGLYLSADGYFWSARLVKDKEYLDEIRKKNSENGKRGGRPSQDETESEIKPTAKRVETETKPTASNPVSENKAVGKRSVNIGKATVKRSVSDRKATVKQGDKEEISRIRKEKEEYKKTHREKAVFLSQVLADFVKIEDPHLEKPPDSWIDAIETLLENGREGEEVEAVIKYSKRKDNFWYPVIISGEKLREKYKIILGQMKRDGLIPQKKVESTPILSACPKCKSHDVFQQVGDFKCRNCKSWYAYKNGEWVEETA